VGLYDELITVAGKIEGIQFGACLDIETDNEATGNYINSPDKLGHIGPIEFRVYDSLKIDPMLLILFPQLEDKKEIDDAYEYLKMDTNRLNKFSKTPFHIKDDAKREIGNLRKTFKNSFNMIDREIKKNELILLRLDNGELLLERWNKIKGRLSERFPCFSNDGMW
jgi:hypothetical protein